MINENDAPEGHTARMAERGCIGCAFRKESLAVCESRTPSCFGDCRPDGEGVIFIKRQEVTE